MSCLGFPEIYPYPLFISPYLFDNVNMLIIVSKTLLLQVIVSGFVVTKGVISLPIHSDLKHAIRLIYIMSLMLAFYCLISIIKILEIIDNFFFSLALAPTGYLKRNYLLYINGVYNNSVFYSFEGLEMTYFNWEPGEPSRLDRDKYIRFATKNNTWQVAKPGLRRFYICETYWFKELLTKKSIQTDLPVVSQREKQILMLKQILILAIGVYF